MMAYNKTTNLAVMFNGSANPATTAPTSNTAVCTACGTEIAPAVADFSRKHYGKYLCRDCQPKGGAGKGSPAAKCEMCGADVDEKVKSYSERKFTRVLCLACQKKASLAPTETPKPADAPAPQNKPEVHCDRCKTVLTPTELTQAENDRRDFNGHLYCARCINELRAQKAAKKGAEPAPKTVPPAEISGSQLPREWSPVKQDTPRTKADMEKTAALNARLIKEAERQNGDALGRCSMSEIDVLLREGGIRRPIEDSGLDIIVDNSFPWPDVME